jgi:iron only hydrogenase large subunit-like protein
MVAALKCLGFDSVLDTDFTADLTIMEEGTELLTRLKKALVDKDEKRKTAYGNFVFTRLDQVHRTHVPRIPR